MIVPYGRIAREPETLATTRKQQRSGLVAPLVPGMDNGCLLLVEPPPSVTSSTAANRKSLVPSTHGYKETKDYL